MQITAPCRFESLSAARPREGPVRERLGAGPSPSRKVPRRPPRSGHVCDHPGEEEKKASPHETKPRRRRGRARWSRTVRGEACKHAVRANQPNDRRHRPDSDPGRCSCPSVRQARHTSTARLPRWLESCASAPDAYVPTMACACSLVDLRRGLSFRGSMRSANTIKEARAVIKGRRHAPMLATTLASDKYADSIQSVSIVSTPKQRRDPVSRERQPWRAHALIADRATTTHGGPTHGAHPAASMRYPAAASGACAGHRGNWVADRQPRGDDERRRQRLLVRPGRGE
jgi:hypothetical protein